MNRLVRQVITKAAVSGGKGQSLGSLFITHKTLVGEFLSMCIKSKYLSVSLKTSNCIGFRSSLTFQAISARRETRRFDGVYIMVVSSTDSSMLVLAYLPSASFKLIWRALADMLYSKGHDS